MQRVGGHADLLYGGRARPRGGVRAARFETIVHRRLSTDR
jgi:hypothetical protein